MIRVQYSQILSQLLVASSDGAALATRQWNGEREQNWRTRNKRKACFNNARSVELPVQEALTIIIRPVVRICYFPPFPPSPLRPSSSVSWPTSQPIVADENSRFIAIPNPRCHFFFIFCCFSSSTFLGL